MNPLISIVVPVYNCEKYLEECVKSLLNQSYSPYEVLLVDDGSTDGSGRLCDAFAVLDKRIQVWHQSNGGVSNARNLGIEKAAGEWLLFVDSDDYVSENFIEEYVTRLKERRDDNCVVFQGYYRVENGKKEKAMLPATYFNSLQKGEALQFLHITHDALGYICSKIFNLRLIKEHHIRFDEKLSLSEDMLFTLAYLQYCNHIYTSSSCTYYYRIDNALSLSKKKIDYLKGKETIERTNALLSTLINNPQVFLTFEKRFLDSRFCLLINLFTGNNTEYNKKFVVREIKEVRELKNMDQVVFTSKSYKLLHWIFLTFSPKVTYVMYKIYFKVKKA